MINSDRLKRVHVVNVRGSKDVFHVLLSDGSSFEWKEWAQMSAQDREYYLYDL